MQGTLKALIEAVDVELTRRQWDYRKLSKELGINMSNWSRVKNEKRTPSLGILILIMQKLPEVEPQVIAYIRDGGKEK